MGQLCRNLASACSGGKFANWEGKLGTLAAITLVTFPALKLPGRLMQWDVASPRGPTWLCLTANKLKCNTGFVR